MKINDIAAMAGVSCSAVSRYFNDKCLSAEKREAIRRVVEETGYVPSRQASMLRTRKTMTIGVLLPRINSSSVSSMIAGILSVLDESGYQLLLADTQNNPEKELEYLASFNEKQVDGIIFIGTVLTAAHRRFLKQMKLPVVLIGQKLPGIRCVYFDDYHSIYEATRLLLKKGREKIGYLSAIHEDEAVGRERYRGYCDALLEFGAGERQNCYEITDFTMESGGSQARSLWEDFGPLDGLVCATDMIAIGAMQFVKDLGLRIPEDVMITGHGDSGYSRVTTPTLTTVHYDYKKSGALAAKMMLTHLNEPGESTAVSEMMLGYSLIENASTAV